MFSNPLLLSRRRCYRRLRLLCLLTGCRSLRQGLLRRLRLLAGFHCRGLHPRLLQGCCLRLRLSDHLRLLPRFRLRPLPGCCLRFHLRRLHPLPSCRRLRLLSGCLSCHAIVCVYCKLGNEQTFGLFVLAVKSRRERFAGPSRNRSGLATTDNSAAARKSLS